MVILWTWLESWEIPSCEFGSERGAPGPEGLPESDRYLPVCHEDIWMCYSRAPSGKFWKRLTHMPTRADFDLRVLSTRCYCYLERQLGQDAEGSHAAQRAQRETKPFGLR